MRAIAPRSTALGATTRTRRLDATLTAPTAPLRVPIRRRPSRCYRAATRPLPARYIHPAILDTKDNKSRFETTNTPRTPPHPNRQRDAVHVDCTIFNQLSEPVKEFSRLEP